MSVKQKRFQERCLEEMGNAKVRSGKKEKEKGKELGCREGSRVRPCTYYSEREVHEKSKRKNRTKIMFG